MQKTGKAVLALKRMAMLSKADNPASLPSPVDGKPLSLSTTAFQNVTEATSVMYVSALRSLYWGSYRLKKQL